MFAGKVILLHKFETVTLHYIPSAATLMMMASNLLDIISLSKLSWLPCHKYAKDCKPSLEHLKSKSNICRLTLRFSDVSRGYRKGALGTNGLKKTILCQGSHLLQCFLLFCINCCRIRENGNRVNLFLTNGLILYPLKTPENQRFYGVFRGYKMKTLVRHKLHTGTKWVFLGIKTMHKTKLCLCSWLFHFWC